MKKLFLMLFLLFQFTVKLYSQSSGDYRATQSGNWNNTAIWQRYNGFDWVGAAQVPTNSDGVITIQNGYTVTVNDSRTADQVIVEAGATLTITNSSFTIADGSGTDLVVNGTLNLSTNTSYLSNSGQITINGTLTSDGIITGTGEISINGTLTSSKTINILGQSQ